MKNPRGLLAASELVLWGMVGGSIAALGFALWLVTAHPDLSILPEEIGHLRVSECVVLFKRADRSVWMVEVVSKNMFALRNIMGSVIYQLPSEFEKYFVRVVCPTKEIP